MAKTKALQKPRMTTDEIKKKKAEISKAAKKHFPKIKKAAEKALRDAGLRGMLIHGMTFRVDKRVLAGQCDPPCGPNEECVWSSSTGEWLCRPKTHS